MNQIDAHTGIEWIEVRRCLQLLETREVGRIGFVLGGAPEILPVNYLLDGEDIVFATAPGSKLRGASGAPVVFEVDDTDQATRSGWSVVVHGTAAEVTSFDPPALVSRVRALPLRPWATGDKPHLIRIRTKSITGRRIAPRPVQADQAAPAEFWLG